MLLWLARAENTRFAVNIHDRFAPRSVLLEHRDTLMVRRGIQSMSTEKLYCTISGHNYVLLCRDILADRVITESCLT